MKEETLNQLKKAVGARAYRYLRRGGFLKCWRQTTPHNWFIETKKGDILWHSEPGTLFPRLKAFEKKHDSDQKVIQYWGADSGSPSLSMYSLKEEFLPN